MFHGLVLYVITIFAASLATRSVSAIDPGGTWIWASGLSNYSLYAMEAVFDAVQLSPDLGPPPAWAPCLQYSAKRHQLIVHRITQVFTYDIATRKWDYLFAGPNGIMSNLNYVFPTPEQTGVPLPSTMGPSGRHQSTCTLDAAEDNLWVVGGSGAAISGTTWQTLDQIWSFSLVSRRWTYWYGSDLANRPVNQTAGIIGGITNAYVGFDTTGKLVIFAGMNAENGQTAFRRDLWTFDPAIKTMKFVLNWPIGGTPASPVNYGSPFVASSSNNPIPVGANAFHTSPNGSIYHFGGAIAQRDFASTMRFDLVGPTTHWWTTLSAPNESSPLSIYPSNSPFGMFNPNNRPGARQGMITFSSSNSDFFAIYGGYVNCPELWVFNTTIAQWSLYWNDTSCTRSSRHTTLPNMISSSATPGIRVLTQGTIDKNGVLWLYSGVVTTNTRCFQDLWAYTNTNCQPGEFFNHTDYICRPCPINTFTSTVNSNASCDACPTFSTTLSQTGQSSCSCNAGFYGDGTTQCTVCPVGTYKATAGNGAQNAVCTPCGVNTFSNNTGSISCTACPASSTTLSSTGATNCTCNPGFYANGSTQCVACPVGTYKARAGNGAECLPCDVNFFSNDIGSQTCTQCPEFSSALGTVSGVTCRCDPGYFGDGLVSCSRCPQGTCKNSFENGPQSSVCTPCWTETSQVSSATTTTEPTSSLDDDKRKADSSSNIIVIAVASGVGGCLLVGVAVYTVMRRKVNAYRRDGSPDNEKTPLQGALGSRPASMQVNGSQPSGTTSSFWTPSQSPTSGFGPNLAPIAPRVNASFSKQSLMGRPIMEGGQAGTTSFNPNTLSFGGSARTNFGSAMNTTLMPSYAIIPASRTLVGANTLYFTNVQPNQQQQQQQQQQQHQQHHI